MARNLVLSANAPSAVSFKIIGKQVLFIIFKMDNGISLFQHSGVVLFLLGRGGGPFTKLGALCIILRKKNYFFKSNAIKYTCCIDSYLRII